MANVKVAVRARPLLAREVDANSPVVMEMKGQSTTLFKSKAGITVGELRDASKVFVYDHSYWSVNKSDHHFASQEQIFSDLGQQVLNSAFEGYNACIFAYGQTGSGKTYTMMGSEASPGLIPRICEGLFAGMKHKGGGQVSYKVEVSYMEIYNEKVRDLLRTPVINKLNSQGTPHNLRVREHPRDGPYVENLSKHQVSDYRAIEELISIGTNHRVTAATKMNDVSSRSHAIFTITFNQAKYIMGIPSETVSKIHLVDLAGSERASQTGSEGLRLKEGGSINKSLVCLGNVISALADMSVSHPTKRKMRYIPYRDSVLTWLIKDSLGGNSKTIMIATVSPCEYSYSETLSTLRYASRAKNIVNKPTVNEDPNVRLIKELREEILRLKDIIKRGDLTEVPPESSLRIVVDLHNKEERIASLTRDWAEKWDGIQRIIEERDLALRSEGVKMTVASEQPHLLGVDEDRFSAGVVLYYLKNGYTSIGHDESEGLNDIVLKAEDIVDMHCKIVLSEGVASLLPLDGVCFVNHSEIKTQGITKLNHGDTLRLGSRTYLRFNHPQEAKKLRDISMETDTSRYSDNSSLWSPLMNNSYSFHSEKMSKLEEERDALRQQQRAIESEYEDKIRTVQEQLQSEKEGRVALQEELQRLREEKMNASLRLSFSASTPMSTSLPRERSLFPMIPSPTPSESDTSLTFEHTFEREVTGQEIVPSYQLSPSREEYPHVERHRRESDVSNILQYSVSMCDNGEVHVSLDDTTRDNIDGKQSEEYLLLETDGSCYHDSNKNSKSTDSQQSEVERLRVISEYEKDELKAHYEEKLQNQTKEKERMKKELLELELQLQLDKSEKVSRRRSYAFSVESDDLENSSKRSLLQYHSHRATKIKISIPAYYLRGAGWSSYHVFEISIKIRQEEWSVYRKYQQFRDFHYEMCIRYPEISSLILPPSKWIGFRSEPFVMQRKIQLERYLKAFIAIVTSSSTSPLAEIGGKKVKMETLQQFNGFFRPGPLQAAVLTQSNTYN